MTALRGRRYSGTTVYGSARRGPGYCVRSTREMSSGFSHRLLLYTSAEEFLATTVPFLRCGLAREDAILVVTSEANIRLLRDVLGDDADLVDFADAIDWYRHPAQTLTAYGDYVNDHPGRPVRVIGEQPWYGRTEAEIREWTCYESMYNTVFADSAVLSICPYDVCALSHEIVARALRTHPEQAIDTASFPNRTYTEPAELAAEQHQEDLPESADLETVVCFDRRNLSELQHLITEQGRRAGMEAEGIAELVLFVTEAAHDVIEQRGGRGTLRMWCRGSHLVCLVREATSPDVRSGGLFAGYLRRLARRWSGSARARPAARRHAGNGGGCRGSGTGWDLPG